ncbi:hypothetical protein ABN034_31930 [Actinopolymorpha sp. B11F2]|uniref:hypothetical protein n=1 Tax=Actinopolymorpha sp. B11F2 TaxID=3160862 RepID=UPI0032E3ECD8
MINNEDLSKILDTPQFLDEALVGAAWRDAVMGRGVALVRARVSRVRYAAVLSAAGRFVPVHLVNDVSER